MSPPWLPQPQTANSLQWKDVVLSVGLLDLGGYGDATTKRAVAFSHDMTACSDTLIACPEHVTVRREGRTSTV